MDNGTIKEICDVVTAEVIKQVRQNLSTMKPELIQSITEESTKRAMNQVKKLIHESTNDEINQLRKKNTSLEQMYARLEQRITKLESMSSTSVSSPQTKSESSSYSALSEGEMRNIRSHGFKVNDWIYYANKSNGNFLYKVRTDGTGNTQLSDCSLFGNGFMHISGGYLYYSVDGGGENKIKI